jgi:hypothetical protein
MTSATVTFRAPTGKLATAVGYGDDVDDARACARMLVERMHPDMVWAEENVSTVATVRFSLWLRPEAV